MLERTLPEVAPAVRGGQVVMGPRFEVGESEAPRHAESCATERQRCCQVVAQRRGAEPDQQGLRYEDAGLEMLERPLPDVAPAVRGGQVVMGPGLEVGESEAPRHAESCATERQRCCQVVAQRRGAEPDQQGLRYEGRQLLRDVL